MTHNQHSSGYLMIRDGVVQNAVFRSETRLYIALR
jgi:hypothetical protein